MGNRGRIIRAAAILLFLIAVMLVLIAIPSYKSYTYRAQKVACQQSLKSAKDGLIIEYLSKFESGSVEDAMRTLDQVMPERPNLCPAGGEVYLIRGEHGIYEPVCGLHDSDRRRRTRLNASRARDLLREALRVARKDRKKEPESVEIHLNGKPLECVRVDAPVPLRRGTRTTSGYEGVVAFYGIAGQGTFAKGKSAEGEVCWFIYADEDFCAIWSDADQWTGDSYSGIITGSV